MNIPGARPVSGCFQSIFKRFFPENIPANQTPYQPLAEPVEILVKNISNFEKNIPFYHAFHDRLATEFCP